MIFGVQGCESVGNVRVFLLLAGYNHTQEDQSQPDKGLPDQLDIRRSC